MNEKEILYLRTHRPDDIEWIVQRQGAIYREEFGWNFEFEALIADIATKFLRDFDPGFEGCWIARRDNEILGSVMLVNAGNGIGKLRLLYVEPESRGLGIGKRLIEECVSFARTAHYQSIQLWTNRILHAAAQLYRSYGFILISEAPLHAFGHDLTEQTWELKL